MHASKDVNVGCPAQLMLARHIYDCGFQRRRGCITSFHHLPSGEFLHCQVVPAAPLLASPVSWDAASSIVLEGDSEGHQSRGIGKHAQRQGKKRRFNAFWF